VEQRKRLLTFEVMSNQLSWLVDRDILRLGLELECERCGLRSWIPVDHAKQHLDCTGCGHEQSLRGAPEWHYELNSLALRCVTSNQLAVLQALCDLASRAHYSFVFTPSMEIYRGDEQRPWHEIDIICLCDGRLIVAEVKDTTIVEGDLDELAEIAEALKADDALLYFPAALAMPKHDQWKRDLNTRLQRSNIRFDYAPLSQV
jgi:ribosomal protein L37E